MCLFIVSKKHCKNKCCIAGGDLWQYWLNTTLEDISGYWSGEVYLIWGRILLVLIWSGPGLNVAWHFCEVLIILLQHRE